MASPTQWTRVWASSRRWWRTGKPGVLQSMRACMLNHFTCIQLFATPWTVTLQILCPWHSSGKNTGANCHTLLQGIFPTWKSNLCLPMSPALQANSFPTKSPASAVHGVGKSQIQLGDWTTTKAPYPSGSNSWEPFGLSVTILPIGTLTLSCI